MHIPYPTRAGNSAHLRPGRGGRRLAALATAILLAASTPLPTFAQAYVTQYTAAFGPTGEALDTVGGVTYLYVADESHGNVVKINVATGATVATFGAGNQGSAPGQFGRPYGIAVDPVSHDLYVAERLNGRIQRINSTTGASVMMWGTNDASFDSAGTNTNPPNPTSPQGHFQEPIGVAADASGNVYVVDHGNNRVQKFYVHQVNGTWTADNVKMWGTTGSGNGQFDHPYGAALDSAGNLWVADGLNGRVQEFDPNGNYLGTAGSKGTGSGQFVIATWVNFDPSGAMWVSSTNSNPQDATAADINSQWISKFTPSGNSATFVSRFGGTYGSNPGEFKLPFDVVVDGANKAYVSDYYNSRVQVMDLTAAPTSGGTTSGGTSSGGTTTGGTSTGGSTSGGTSSGGTSTGGTSTGGTTSGGTSSGGTSTGGTSTGGTSTGGTSTGGTSTGGTSTGGTSTGGTTSTSATNVVSVTTPSDGTYHAGDALQFTVTFSQPVTVAAGETASAGADDTAVTTQTSSDDQAESGDDAKPASGDSEADTPDAGVPQIAWAAIGGGDSGAATYVSGSGSTQLTFKYQVHGNDSAPVGIQLGSAIVLPNGTALEDASGQPLSPAALQLPWAQNQLTGVILVPANESDHGSDGGDGKSAGKGGKNSAGGGTVVVTSGHGNGHGKDDARLVNLSSRLQVEHGDASHTVVVGFVISGTAPQPVLVRAVGPGLRAFGIKDALTNPTLTVRDSTGQVVATNSGWNNNSVISAVTQQVGAFALAFGSHDAALLLNLAPGAYTATVDGTKGTALIEVYDAATGSAITAPQLANISTRGYVDAGENLITGLVVHGTTPQRVLIRAVGPGLAAFGVPGTLSDPSLQVHDAAGATIAANDNWETPVAANASYPPAAATDITAADAAVGAFPLSAGSKDAAVVLTLQPGSYSVVVTGAANTSGAVLVEVYGLPTP